MVRKVNKTSSNILKITNLFPSRKFRLFQLVCTFDQISVHIKTEQVKANHDGCRILKTFIVSF